MSGDELERERRESADALRKVSEGALRVDVARDSKEVLGEEPVVKTASASAPLPGEPAPWNPPPPPILPL